MWSCSTPSSSVEWKKTEMKFILLCPQNATSIKPMKNCSKVSSKVSYSRNWQIPTFSSSLIGFFEKGQESQNFQKKLIFPRSFQVIGFLQIQSNLLLRFSSGDCIANVAPQLPHRFLLCARPLLRPLASLLWLQEAAPCVGKSSFLL